MLRAQRPPSRRQHEGRGSHSTRPGGWVTRDKDGSCQVQWSSVIGGERKGVPCAHTRAQPRTWKGEESVPRGQRAEAREHQGCRGGRKPQPSPRPPPNSARCSGGCVDWTPFRKKQKVRGALAGPALGAMREAQWSSLPSAHPPPWRPKQHPAGCQHPGLHLQPSLCLHSRDTYLPYALSLGVLITAHHWEVP